MGSMDRVSADYKMTKEKCASLARNSKDVCMAEAKGAERIAKAEREAQYKPSTKATHSVDIAKADAA